MIKFVLPTEENRDDVLYFYDEFENNRENCIGYGGHIGYAVRPSMRNRRLATEMLAEGLENSKKFGFEKVLLVCDENNYQSEKVIIKNDGVFENKLYDDDEKVFVKRYWRIL